MAQKMLFGGMQTKGGRKNDKALIKNATPKKSEPITYVTGNKFKDIVIQAKSMSHKILGDLLPRLELVTDEERLSEYIAKIIDYGEYAIDSETSGLLPYKDICAGICLYVPGEKGIYVPINHLSQLTHERVKNQISPSFMSRQLRRLARLNVPWIGHNCKFEMNVIYWQLNVRMNTPKWDTLTASIMLNENESHSLKIQHTKYVLGDEDKQVAKFNALFQGIQFPLIPTDIAYMYASYDPIMTYELYEFQLPYLTPEHETCIEFDLVNVAKYFHDIEMPLIEVLFDMEIHGVSLDIEFMEELRERFESELVSAEEEFKELVSQYRSQLEDLRTYDFANYQKLELDESGNVTVSIGSATQLAILFYDILGFHSNDHKKPRGTGADILAGFDSPIAEVILRYRKFSKLVSTYLNMDEFQANNDKRIHTNYNANGARTGRLSSDRPNMQNIPAHSKEGILIRQMFRASEGYYIIGSDYSQQEPRSLAALSGDKDMIQAYVEGKDLYGVIGSTLYNLPYEECLEFNTDGTPNPEGKERRSKVKSVLLGQHIGSSSLNVAKRCA